MWRCVNDKFLYCTSEPDWENPELHTIPCRDNIHGIVDVPTGNKCKLDPKTCGRSQTFSEQIIVMESSK